MPALTQKCRITNKEFTVDERELAHLRRMGELNPLIGESLPVPCVHPFEQLRQVLALGNLQYLYRSKSFLSGTPQLSRYNPASEFKITTLDEFWSDRVDNTSAGRDYDFNRPFFEQFNELLRDSCLQPLNLTNAEGSDFVNGATNVQNCYLCFSVGDSQDCLYCMRQYFGNDNVCCVGSNRSQFCYDSVDIDSCYECHHCQDCRNCSNCFSCLDCIGCKNCIGCVGLRSAEFHIFNQSYTERGYKDFLSRYSLGNAGSRASLLDQCIQFAASVPYEVNTMINTEDCTGSYIANCKNMLECFNSNNSEDCGYMIVCNKGKDCWRGFAVSSELAYQSLVLDSYNSLYSYSIFNGQNCLYSWFLYNRCANCFGCAFLKGKSYCVLNKQYSKSEYCELVPRIIAHMKSTGEWGEFFPPLSSPHVYAEAWIGDFFEDISAEEKKRRGYRTDPLPEEQTVEPYHLTSEELPLDISDVDDENLTKQTVKCLITAGAKSIMDQKTAKKGSEGHKGNCSTVCLYRFQKKEIDFFKRQNIPLPRLHWRERLRRLTAKRRLIPAI
jgi:hypothetical protein